MKTFFASLARGRLSPAPRQEVACSARADPGRSQLTGVSAPVAAARAPDPALADQDKVPVILGPTAADVGGTPGPAPPYSGPSPRPVLLGPGRTLVTSQLALADVGATRDSTLAVFGETPGLGLADPGGTVGPAPAPFWETPGLPPALDRVSPGMSPAGLGGTPGRVAAPAEASRAVSFLPGSIRTPQGPVSAATLRRGSREAQPLVPPAAGCASAAYPWPSP